LHGLPGLLWRWTKNIVEKQKQKKEGKKESHKNEKRGRKREI